MTSPTTVRDADGGPGSRAASRQRQLPRRRARRWAPPLVCILVYLLLGALVYGAKSPVSNTYLPPCACGDISSQTWFLAWPAYALSSGHNLFYSSYVAYPAGVNLMTNTGAPLLGVVFAPVTLLVGAIASFNLVMHLAFALSAIAMCFVLRRWTSWWPAAFIGGLIYAFSPYMVGQGLSHDFLIFVPLPPIMVALVDEALVRRRHPVRNGLLLGVVVTAQLLISPEVLEITGLLILVGLVAVVLRHPVGTLERARDVGAALAAAALSGVVLSAYPLWMYFEGPYHVSGPPHPVSLLSNYYSTVLGLIYPTPFQHFTLGHWLVRGEALTQGGNSEYTTYLGIPLLVLLAVIGVRFWRVGLVQLFMLAAFLAWVVTLGGSLYYRVPGKPGMTLPDNWLQKIPLIQGALDLRYSLAMYLAVAVVVAVGLDRFRRDGFLPVRTAPLHARQRMRSRGAWCAVLAAAALVLYIPALPYKTGVPAVPTLFTAKDSPIRKGSVVLAYPLPVAYIGFNAQLLLYQAQADMRFKLIGFRGAVAGAHNKPVRDEALLLPPLQAELLLTWALNGSPAPPPPADAATYAAIRTFLTRYHVGAVTSIPVWPHSATVVAYFTAALHTPPVLFQGNDVWPDVQADLARVHSG
jgi:hypothetical protein